MCGTGVTSIYRACCNAVNSDALVVPSVALALDQRYGSKLGRGFLAQPPGDTQPLHLHTVNLQVPCRLAVLIDAPPVALVARLTDTTRLAALCRCNRCNESKSQLNAARAAQTVSSTHAHPLLPAACQHDLNIVLQFPVRQSPTLTLPPPLASPIIKPLFFLHSPAATHVVHCLCMSTHRPGSWGYFIMPVRMRSENR